MGTHNQELTEQEQQWQKQLDTAAVFNSLGVPDPSKTTSVIYMPGSRSSIAGFHLQGSGHRFEVGMRSPTVADGVRASNVVGNAHFRFSMSLRLIPDDFEVYPGVEVPPTAWEPGRSQRFAIMDPVFDFGGANRLTAIGTGQTFPLGHPDQGGRIPVTGVGGFLKGSGPFGSEPQGNFVLNGFVAASGEFQLNMLLRIQDDSRNLLVSSLPAIQPIPSPIDGTTTLIVRTAAWPKTTDVTFSKEKLPTALQTWEAMTEFGSGFFSSEATGPQSEIAIGESLGRHHVAINFLAGPTNKGTVVSPIPFNDEEKFVFHDAGGAFVGAFTAPVADGRSWFTTVPGVPADLGVQLAAGFGPITGGTGCFAGISGSVTNVGIGTFIPHLTSLVYMVQIADPTGRFRVD